MRKQRICDSHEQKKRDIKAEIARYLSFFLQQKAKQDTAEQCRHAHDRIRGEHKYTYYRNKVCQQHGGMKTSESLHGISLPSVTVLFPISLPRSQV